MASGSGSKDRIEGEGPLEVGEMGPKFLTGGRSRRSPDSSKDRDAGRLGAFGLPMEPDDPLEGSLKMSLSPASFHGDSGAGASATDELPCCPCCGPPPARISARRACTWPSQAASSRTPCLSVASCADPTFRSSSSSLSRSSTLMEARYAMMSADDVGLDMPSVAFDSPEHTHSDAMRGVTGGRDTPGNLELCALPLWP